MDNLVNDRKFVRLNEIIYGIVIVSIVLLFLTYKAIQAKDSFKDINEFKVQTFDMYLNFIIAEEDSATSFNKFYINIGNVDEIEDISDEDKQILKLTLSNNELIFISFKDREVKQSLLSSLQGNYKTLVPGKNIEYKL